MRLRPLACLLLAPAAAFAQPRLVPAGDVDVLYHLSGPAADAIPGGAPDGVRLQWDAADQRLRSEPVGGPIYAIVDLERHVLDVVLAGQHTYLEFPLRTGAPQDLATSAAGADAHFTRGGTTRLLGLECTDWTVHARKLDATGCVTADGIVLRAEGTWDGRAGRLEAVSVRRDAVPPDRFRPPEGSSRVGFANGR